MLKITEKQAFVSRKSSLDIIVATRGQCCIENEPQPALPPLVEPRNFLHQRCHYLFTSAYYTDLGETMRFVLICKSSEINIQIYSAVQTSSPLEALIAESRDSRTIVVHA